LPHSSQEYVLTGQFTVLLDRFRSCRVLVAGDMVADEYILGRPWSISREAPVLVLRHADRFVRLGGATNTAYNISTLGAQAIPFGIIGDDEMGRWLRLAIEESGMSTEGLLVDRGRPTSTKTRVLAGVQEVQQQIVRVDRIDDREVSDELRGEMIDNLCAALPHADALLISDYENGAISQQVIEACLPEARRNGLIITVDSHGDLFRFQGITAVTPNQPEAEAALGRPIRDDLDLARAGEALLLRMDAGGVLITRGSQGLALFQRDQEPYHLPVAPAHGSEVVDATGAGDTVAAVFTLALAAGMSMRMAAYLGNVAGGEVVQHLGAVPLSPSQFEGALERTSLHMPD